MLCDLNEQLEPRNFKDPCFFRLTDPCIFVSYIAGASGDLLLSIIDKHYLNTGSQYYGISDTGQVRIYTTDFEAIDFNKAYQFDSNWLAMIDESLSTRGMNASSIDRALFGSHMWRDEQVKNIIQHFPNAKVIRIMPVDEVGSKLAAFLRLYKNDNILTEWRDLVDSAHKHYTFKHPRLLDLPFGFMFNEELYFKYYDQIIDFLELEGRLICFDYIKFYLSKQHPSVRDDLIAYSNTL